MPMSFNIPTTRVLLGCVFYYLIGWSPSLFNIISKFNVVCLFFLGHRTHKSICIEWDDHNEIVNSHPPCSEHYLHQLEKAELPPYSEKQGKNPLMTLPSTNPKLFMLEFCWIKLSVLPHGVMTLPSQLIGMHLKFLFALYVLYSMANFKYIKGKNATIWLRLTLGFFLWCINHTFHVFQ